MKGNNEPTKEELIDAIVELEWTEFDQVLNEGGRANCQDDWDTFSIMRRSQYLTWSEEMLHEYLWHLKDSYDRGRNLISEKYGRMMESTVPERYEQIKEAFPKLSEIRKQIMEEVIQIQVKWMDDFAEKYPKLAGQVRAVHTNQDSAFITSYETYLRGELGTYSDELMKYYAQFVVELCEKKQNLAFLTMENTVHMYGYPGLEEAEGALRG